MTGSLAEAADLPSFRHQLFVGVQGQHYLLGPCTVTFAPTRWRSYVECGHRPTIGLDEYRDRIGGENERARRGESGPAGKLVGQAW